MAQAARLRSTANRLMNRNIGPASQDARDQASGQRLMADADEIVRRLEVERQRVFSEPAVPSEMMLLAEMEEAPALNVPRAELPLDVILQAELEEAPVVFDVPITEGLDNVVLPLNVSQETEVIVSNFYGDEYLDENINAGDSDVLAALTSQGELSGELDVGGLVSGQAAGLGSLAIRLLRALMGSASRVTAQHWSRLPGWAQAALGAVGVGVGVELATGNIPFIDLPGGGGDGGFLEGGEFVGNRVVKRWTANGIQFAKLADGRIAVQRKDGTVKIYRPKKPIVIYGSGASNLKDLLRADAAVQRQTKKLDRVLRRRHPKKARATARPAGHDHDGPTIIRQG